MGVPPARANKAICRVTRFIQHKSRPATLYIPSKLLSFTVNSFPSGMVSTCRYVVCCRTTCNGGSLRKSRKICVVTKIPVREYIAPTPPAVRKLCCSRAKKKAATISCTCSAVRVRLRVLMDLSYVLHVCVY